MQESAYAVTYGYGSGDVNRSDGRPQPEASTAGAHDSWLGRSAVRLNALWEDGGVSGRDYRRAQEPVDRALDRIGLEHRDARHGRRTGHTAGQPARLRDSRRRVVRDAACTDDGDRDQPGRFQENFYGSVGSDFDKVEQESYTGRVEHDVNSNLTLRNQTRYNETHRTAVITAIQNPASLRARDADGDARAAGQRTRELDPVESDECRDAISRPGAYGTRRRWASRLRLKSNSRRR